MKKLFILTLCFVFTFTNIVTADYIRQDKLASASRFGAYFEHHGFNLADLASFIASVHALKPVVEGEGDILTTIKTLNETTLSGTSISIQEAIGTDSLGGIDVTYLTFNFDGETRKIYFLEDYQKFALEILGKIGIAEKDIPHLEVPTVENVWIADPTVIVAAGDGTREPTPYERLQDLVIEEVMSELTLEDKRKLFHGDDHYKGEAARRIKTRIEEIRIAMAVELIYQVSSVIMDAVPDSFAQYRDLQIWERPTAIFPDLGPQVAGRPQALAMAGQPIGLAIRLKGFLTGCLMSRLHEVLRDGQAKSTCRRFMRIGTSDEGTSFAISNTTGLVSWMLEQLGPVFPHPEHFIHSGRPLMDTSPETDMFLRLIKDRLLLDTEVLFHTFEQGIPDMERDIEERAKPKGFKGIEKRQAASAEEKRHHMAVEFQPPKRARFGKKEGWAVSDKLIVFEHFIRNILSVSLIDRALAGDITEGILDIERLRHEYGAELLNRLDEPGKTTEDLTGELARASYVGNFVLNWGTDYDQVVKSLAAYIWFHEIYTNPDRETLREYDTAELAEIAESFVEGNLHALGSVLRLTDDKSKQELAERIKAIHEHFGDNLAIVSSTLDDEEPEGPVTVAAGDGDTRGESDTDSLIQELFSKLPEGLDPSQVEVLVDPVEWGFVFAITPDTKTGNKQVVAQVAISTGLRQKLPGERTYFAKGHYTSAGEVSGKINSFTLPEHITGTNLLHAKAAADLEGAVSAVETKKKGLILLYTDLVNGIEDPEVLTLLAEYLLKVEREGMIALDLIGDLSLPIQHDSLTGVINRLAKRAETPEFRAISSDATNTVALLSEGLHPEDINVPSIQLSAQGEGAAPQLINGLSVARGIIAVGGVKNVAGPLLQAIRNLYVAMIGETHDGQPVANMPLEQLLRIILPSIDSKLLLNINYLKEGFLAVAAAA